MADPSRNSDTGIDPVLAVLIAQLLDREVLDADDIGDMMRRLEEGGDDDLAQGLFGVMLSAAIDTPERRRAAIHVISDGGNEPE